jgi:titin
MPDELLGALQKNLEEYPEEEMYSKDRPQPPKFKVHIKSHLNLNEDDHCIFESKLIPVRDPKMRVQWFKNGKPLHHGTHRSLYLSIYSL